MSHYHLTNAYTLQSTTCQLSLRTPVSGVRIPSDVVCLHNLTPVLLLPRSSCAPRRPPCSHRKPLLLTPFYAFGLPAYHRVPYPLLGWSLWAYLEPLAPPSLRWVLAHSSSQAYSARSALIKPTSLHSLIHKKKKMRCARPDTVCGCWLVRVRGLLVHCLLRLCMRCLLCVLGYSLSAALNEYSDAPHGFHWS